MSDSSQRIRVGSRDSRLAVVQAESVIALLKRAHPELAIEHHTQKTLGDKFLQVPLSEVGNGGQYGVFVKELEEALLAGRIDLAVHSLKDMSSHVPDGLTLWPIGPREDVRDAWLCPSGLGFADLPPGSRVGTSALRRVAQLRRWRDDLEYVPIRGNLQTRWRKLEAGEVNALVLAAAGCHRMAESEPVWRERITACFDPLTEMVPAVGQGVLAVEYRSDDEAMAEMLRGFQDLALAAAVTLERTLMATLEGGCQLPLGVFTEPWLQGAGDSGGALRVTVRLLSADGSQCVEDQRVIPISGIVSDAVALAHDLLAQGGQTILDEIRQAKK